MAHLTQIDFSKVSGPQRVAAYNEMAVKLGRPLVKKFENSTKAIARCEALQAILTDVPREIQELNEKDPPKKSVAISKPNGVAKPTKVVVRHALRDERVIHLVAGAKAPREGTDYEAHLAKMSGRPTVAQYLAKFADDRRKVARHWLFNARKDGKAEVR